MTFIYQDHLVPLKEVRCWCDHRLKVILTRFQGMDIWSSQLDSYSERSLCE